MPVLIYAILGSCQIVRRIGTLRTKIGDAHEKGGKPMKPGARPVHLAVNLAGTMATFPAETWLARGANAVANVALLSTTS